MTNHDDDEVKPDIGDTVEDLGEVTKDAAEDVGEIMKEDWEATKEHVENIVTPDDKDDTKDE